MITDARVLDEEVVPERELVVHRREEFDALADALDPITRGTAGSHVFLIGSPGTGKSMLARVSLDQLAASEAAWADAYVNCWQTRDRSSILFSVAQELLERPVQRQSTPLTSVIERLETDPDDPRVVVLDEVDQLASKDVLYDLHALPATQLVLIANSREDVFANMNERVASRFTVGHQIDLEPYAVVETTDILAKRAAYGLAPDAIDEAHLERIAEYAAGDARAAIAILRVAAERAQTGHAARIRAEHVEMAVDQARQSLRRASLDRLSDHQRVLYDIIEDRGPLQPSQLYERYRDAVADPRTKRTVRTYLSKMDHYRLVESDGQGKNRVYRAARTQSVTRPGNS